MSDEWIVNNCAVLVVIIFVLMLGRFLSRQQNVRVTYFMGVILFFTSRFMARCLGYFNKDNSNEVTERVWRPFLARHLFIFRPIVKRKYTEIYVC